MATIKNDRDTLLLAASPRVLWTGARGVNVVSDYPSFNVTEGTPSVASITLTSTLNGISGTVNWSVVTGTATLDSATGSTTVLQYTNMISDTVVVRASVTDSGVTYIKDTPLSKVLNGTAAKFITLSTNGQVFSRADSFSTFSPTSVTLTATATGGTVTGNTYTFQYWTGSAWSTLQTGTSTTYSVTSGSFSGSRTFRVSAVMSGNTVTDDITLVQITGGTNTLTGFLTNESVSMATDNAGTTPANISTLSQGTFKVYFGNTDVTSSCTFSKVDSSCTTSISNVTGLYSASAMSADNAFSTFTATHPTYGSVSKVFSLAKTRAGAVGSNGSRTAIGVMYQWSVSAPTSFPVGTSTYTWSTGAFTAPATTNGWSLTQPAAVAGQTLWGCSVVFSDSATTSTTNGTWSTTTAYPVSYAGSNGTNGTNGTNGVNGTRTAVLDMYQVAASAPTTFPSGTSTYTWATGQFTAPATPNGWSLTPPAAVLGQTLWIARTVYADSGTTSTSSVTWSATSAISLGASGVNGTRTAFLEMYIWSATTPVAFPSGSSTYTWATGAFTAPSTPNGWSITPPAAVAGQTLWGCSVLYADTGTSATSPVTWSTSTAYAVGAAGATGATGSRASVVSLYRWAYSDPLAPDGTTTYTWATGTWTHASDTRGWEASVPIDNSVGKTLWYVEKAVVDSTGVATTSTINSTGWSSVTRVNLSRNGDAALTCYSKFTGNGATPSGTATTSLGSYPTANGFTGATFLAAFTATPPSLASGEALYVSDGYSTTAGQVVWNTPYVSSFRVGSLSALNANLGTITAGNITVENTTNGFVKGGQTAYNTGTGFWLGYDAGGTAGYKFSIGNGTSGLTWDGTNFTVTGAITATSGSFTGTLTAGSMVYSSASTATTPTSGSGAVFNSNGKFSIGDTTNNITYNGTTVTLNGTFVKNNIIANTTDLASINSNLGNITGGSLTIGSASTVFKVDSTGNIWSGNTAFASAPFKVSNAGALTATGVTITGNITATSGSFTGDLTSGTATPTGIYPSNTMTGYGFKVSASNGAFVLGNATTNFAFDGTNNIVVNGAIVKAGNISVTDLSSIKNDMGAIVAGSITLNTSGFIKGGQTAYNTGTGFWLGYDSTTYKFSIGSSTKSLTWDGTNLTLTGDLNTTGKVIAQGGGSSVTIGGTNYTASIIGVTTTANHGVFGATDTGIGVRALADQGGTALQVTRKGNGVGYGIYATNAGTGAAYVGYFEGLNNANIGLYAKVPTGGTGFAALLEGNSRILNGSLSFVSSQIIAGGSAGSDGQTLRSGGASAAPYWSAGCDGGSGTTDASGNATVTVNGMQSSNFGFSAITTSGCIVTVTSVTLVSGNQYSVVVQTQTSSTGAAAASKPFRWTAIG